MALAENSGLNPVETLTNLRSDQKTSGNPRLGVDALYTGNRDMKVIRSIVLQKILACILGPKRRRNTRRKETAALARNTARSHDFKNRWRQNSRRSIIHRQSTVTLSRVFSLLGSIIPEISVTTSLSSNLEPFFECLKLSTTYFFSAKSMIIFITDRYY